MTIRWAGDTETAPALAMISVGTGRDIIEAGRPILELRADHVGLHWESPWPSHGVRPRRFLPDHQLRELSVRALDKRYVLIARDESGTEHEVAVHDVVSSMQWLARRLRAHLGIETRAAS